MFPVKSRKKNCEFLGVFVSVCFGKIHFSFALLNFDKMQVAVIAVGALCESYSFPYRYCDIISVAFGLLLLLFHIEYSSR